MKRIVELDRLLEDLRVYLLNQHPETLKDPEVKRLLNELVETLD
jgi:hypothetical protein